MSMPGRSSQHDRHESISMQTTGLRIEVVAARAGVSVRRVQYLERAGLVAPAISDEQSRLYNEAAIERIQLIERLIGDLGVNLPGAEVILNMRERMLHLLDELDNARNQ
jgi:MerR family transcriptional regulator/heat shock protein HspR